ncbi:MAG: TM0996/MTH895 family glutaredoxin-like protein [Candidatus Atribacteria bacterium]|nr:TM0996/MTH895 family glutaredoxin-like protein [Candidatus Atribacteria bacterium]
MKIQVVGAGCPKCQMVEANVKKACEELKLGAEVSHVYDVREFPKLGVRITPAVLVDGKIVVAGKVPTVEELKKLLGG